MPARIHIGLVFFSEIITLFLFVSLGSAMTLLSNGQLTVQADGVPLTTILEEISKQGNISIQTHGPLARQMVTIHFGPLPLEKGLKRILKKDNYLTAFDKDGNIIRLIIASKASAPLAGGNNALPQVGQVIPEPPPEDTPPQDEQLVPEPPEQTETDTPQEQPEPELPEAKNN